MQIPRRKSEELHALKRRDDGPVHITKAGLEHIQQRLDRLKKGLPDLISEAERTAAYGDRSENAEYKDAKARLRAAHRTLFSLQDQIRRAVIIRPGAGGDGVVHIGSTVTIDIKGEEKTFQILGSHETDPGRGRISYKSPVGAALMGHKKGDTVHIKIGNSTHEYRILEVR